mmetsp:Transcript_26988/g.83546  ORF Transcript_26988/g.83546 Transcript_26988/m.83546 type:complete len:323 (-) Transcript_26988:34-1002(-)
MTDAKPREFAVYPIGTPGKPWTAEETDQWRAKQLKQRDYFTLVVSRLMRLPESSGATVFQYGELDYRKFGAARFPLFAAKSANWDAAKPMVLITGGLHGYETSGIMGALQFIETELARATARGVNVLVLPCISPWGFETINRWTPNAVDPNRTFIPGNPLSEESKNAMAVIEQHVAQSSAHLMHVDLHETTDTDNSEFTPAKAARDGEAPPKWYPIPDGFYLIGDEPRPQLEWHETMIAAVREVTHIAEPDENGTIVDEPVTKPGILILPAVGDCASFTPAKFTTTTEVYPDSKRTNPDECNRAQAACVVAGLEYALAHADL